MPDETELLRHMADSGMTAEQVRRLHAQLNEGVLLLTDLYRHALTRDS